MDCIRSPFLFVEKVFVAHFSLKVTQNRSSSFIGKSGFNLLIYNLVAKNLALVVIKDNSLLAVVAENDSRTDKSVRVVGIRKGRS
jgi:hypothetical protein